MARRHYLPEEIINELGEAEVLLAEGMTVAEVAKAIGVVEQAYYRWRKQYNTVRPHSSLGYRPPAPEIRTWQCGAKTEPLPLTMRLACT